MTKQFVERHYDGNCDNQYNNLSNYSTGTFYSTSNDSKLQNESVPLQEKQEEVAHEELVESTENPDNLSEKHMEKMGSTFFC